MIRVFVLVTGISLAHFPSAPDQPARVLMVTGLQDEEADVELHGVTIVHGYPQKVLQRTSATPVIQFSAPCRRPCGPIEPPQNIVSLHNVLRQPVGKIEVRRECLNPRRINARFRRRCESAEGRPLLNGHLTFEGGWRVGSTVVCGNPGASGGEMAVADAPTPAGTRARASALPAPQGPHGTFAYPPATQPLARLTFGTVGVVEEPAVGNTMVFIADIEESQLGDLLKIDGERIALTAIDSSEGNNPCADGFGLSAAPAAAGSAPQKCVLVGIVNHIRSTVLTGGSDRHFAAIYGLLKDGSSTGRPIPRVDSDPCPPPPGGIGGLGGCIGGYVRQ